MKLQQLVWALATAALGVAISTIPLRESVAAVGSTESVYGVDQLGNAKYSMPIRVTDGINGLTPRLAITYVGPKSRSILGVGFSISGFSYIRPCRRTIAQDLAAAPVTLTSADRYCLDGAKLRSINGIYGATNSTYRTEVDQLVRITSLGSTANIPGWFKVEMSDGLVYEYGNSTDSKLLSSAQTGATPQFWAVSKITDRFDNSMTFHYDKNDSARRFRPSYISYTERGGSGHYKVSFVYQTTTFLRMFRFTPSSAGEGAHKEDKLLDRIDLKHDEVVYRSYKFTYQNGATDNKRLLEVQECAAGPPEDCMPATQFSWQSATAGHNALASSSNAVATGVAPLDINRDGVEDLVWANGGTWRYMLGGGSGYGSCCARHLVSD